MKKSNLFLISILFLTLQSCLYKDVEIKEIEDYTINSISKEEIDIDVKLSIYNPNFFNIKIKQVKLNAFLNKDFLGKTLIENEIILPKKSNYNEKLNIKIKLKKGLNKAMIMQLASTLFFEGGILLKIKGDIEAKALIFNKKISFSFSKKYEFDEFKALFIK